MATQPTLDSAFPINAEGARALVESDRFGGRTVESFEQLNAAEAKQKLVDTSSNKVMMKLNDESSQTTQKVYFLIHFTSDRVSYT